MISLWRVRRRNQSSAKVYEINPMRIIFIQVKIKTFKPFLDRVILSRRKAFYTSSWPMIISRLLNAPLISEEPLKHLANWPFLHSMPSTFMDAVKNYSKRLSKGLKSDSGLMWRNPVIFKRQEINFVASNFSVNLSNKNSTRAVE